MREDRIKTIILTTKCIKNRTYSLWLLLTNYIKHLTTDELFSYIPLIWQVDIFSNQKFFGIRQMLEKEIKERQDVYTIIKLLELLTNDNSNLRFVGVDLLCSFKDNIIIDPLLTYLKTTSDDYLTKRQAICALEHYNDSRIKEYLMTEYVQNKNNQDVFFRNNYLSNIEWIIKKKYS